MLMKQTSVKFSSISEEELMRVNGGKLSARRSLLEIADIIEKIDMEKVGKKINEVSKRLVILGRELANKD